MYGRIEKTAEGGRSFVLSDPSALNRQLFSVKIRSAVVRPFALSPVWPFVLWSLGARHISAEYFIGVSAHVGVNQILISTEFRNGTVDECSPIQNHNLTNRATESVCSL
jgi:hypothetical protein